MLIALIAITIVVLAFIVSSSEKKGTVVVEHHHHTTVIERPVYVQAQINLIVARIIIDQARLEPEPVRLPEARTLVRSSVVRDRYLLNERNPS